MAYTQPKFIPYRYRSWEVHDQGAGTLTVWQEPASWSMEVLLLSPCMAEGVSELSFIRAWLSFTGAPPSLPNIFQRPHFQILYWGLGFNTRILGGHKHSAWSIASVGSMARWWDSCKRWDSCMSRYIGTEGTVAKGGLGSAQEGPWCLR